MDQDELDCLKFNQEVEVENKDSTQKKIYFPQNRKNKDFGEFRKKLANNILGCDFTICLLQAAVRSYRSDSCLRPFPQCFVMDNNEKDFISFKFACDNIPALKNLVATPLHSFPKETIRLLTWLFNDKAYPYLEPYSIKNVPFLKCESKTSAPHYIFKVCHSEKSEELWKNRVESHEVFYAYHGSSIDNFFSILKFGLQQHLSNGKVLFGTGIYLSNELSLCMNYAPFGKTWENSMLGSKHSIIALCEVIKDINKVKCKDTRNNHGTLSSNLTAIPEKYFVVTDSEMVRVRYLLVYKQNIKTVINSFIIKNSFWLVIFLYFVMLVLVGFFNGPYWPKLLNYFKNESK